MAPPAGSLRVGRYFLALGILFVVLYGIAFFPGTSSHTPKLGLDLVGGAQVVLQATTNNGSPPTGAAMNEARTIIQDRVDGRGVSNSEVAIEGSNRITVTIPGKRADDITNIGDTALLEFRPLIAGPFQQQAPAATATPSASGATPGTPAATPAATPGGTPAATASAAPSVGAAPSTGSVSPQDNYASPLGNAALPLAAATTPAATATTPATTAPAATAPAPAATAPAPAGTAPAASAPPTVAPSVSGAASVTPEIITSFRTAYATVPGLSNMSDDQVKAVIAFNCKDKPSTNPKLPIVSCNTAGSSKYLLNTVLFPGTEVSDATSVAPGTQNIQWTVSLKLKTTGQNIWADYTSKHHNADSTGNTADTLAADYVAFTLDGRVVSAPNINSTITGDTQVSGQFTQASATQLANSLKYGALPLSFSQLTSQTVSATLGTSQLKAALLAGGIGLALVVIYSLTYYRGLGLVTLASLIVSGGLIYSLLIFLGRQIGFTLTLAGIAGFIVAIGITADSFVVLFERIKDEVHDGRSIRVAVPRAWVRARRTILQADFVSLLAAAVLYFLAAGEVRGFAFTLGLSTVLDVLVVFWFTHPMVSLLSRSRTFGSARFTGLKNVRGTLGSGGATRATGPVRRADRGAGPGGVARSSDFRRPASHRLACRRPPCHRHSSHRPAFQRPVGEASGSRGRQGRNGG